ncbi:MAG: type II toxin-antitoxin system death-on-curing family toxin [Chloroflexota bacterium]
MSTTSSGCTPASSRSPLAPARDRLRAAPALESALARPIHHATYEGADIAMLAAILAHGIAQSQSFLDGNKRTALIALSTFLALNDWDVDVPDLSLRSSSSTLPQAPPLMRSPTSCAPRSARRHLSRGRADRAERRGRTPTPQLLDRHADAHAPSRAPVSTRMHFPSQLSRISSN